MRILLAGMIAGTPQRGGATWTVLQYLLGLRDLGHEVVLVDPVEALDHATLAYFHGVVASFELASAAALHVPGTRETVGVSYDRLCAFADSADLLLDVAGMLRDSALFDGPAVRTYLDLDPAFTQLGHAVEGIDMRFDGHDTFVTAGTNVGLQTCDIPTCERTWVRTFPPVLLERWPVAEGPPKLPFTTVASWRGSGSVTWADVVYGQKAHSLRPLPGLPQRVEGPFAVALSVHPDERTDHDSFDWRGWELLDTVEAVGDPSRYQRFVQDSTGELGIAKSGYVVSRSGWFSDRSACYLASGRPVIAQDTGFDAHLPTGEGLFAFDSVDDVATAVEAIRVDYPRHRRAARALAEDLLDSRRVLPLLLDAVMHQ